MQRTREKVAPWVTRGTPGWPTLLQTRPRIVSKALRCNLYTIKFTPFECIYFAFYHQILHESNIYTQKTESTRRQSTARVEPPRASSKNGLVCWLLQLEHSVQVTKKQTCAVADTTGRTEDNRHSGTGAQPTPERRASAASTQRC